MSRQVARIEFADGVMMYAPYSNTVDALIGRELYDTVGMAQEALEACDDEGALQLTERIEPLGARSEDEPVVVRPGWRANSDGWSIASRASRKHRWVTGAASSEEESRDHRERRDRDIVSLFAGDLGCRHLETRGGRLGHVEVGALVEVVDATGRVVSGQLITKLHRDTVRTNCGRRWTKENGALWVGDKVDAALSIRRRRVF